MITVSERDDVDPIMAPVDRLPAAVPDDAETESEASPVQPFGMRFALTPPGMGDHNKTYYTVKVDEPTTINKDGTEVTITDSVDRERED